jgi:hypothetical protein
MMKNYHEFHDGWFEGLWIDGKRVHVYLSTVNKKAFTMVAQAVAGLSVDGLKTGNIILDVLVKTHEELNDHDVATLPELQMIDTTKPNLALQKVHEQKLSVMEINPSYGGSCLILAQSFALFERTEWFQRYAVVSR